LLQRKNIQAKKGIASEKISTAEAGRLNIGNVTGMCVLVESDRLYRRYNRKKGSKNIRKQRRVIDIRKVTGE